MFAQGLADVLAGGRQKSVGDAAADHQLFALLGQGFQHGQLGGNLGAADDGDHGASGVGQGLVQRQQLFRHQHAGAGDGRVLGDAVSGSFGAVSGAEGVHDEHVTQGCVFARRSLDVLLLALVDAAVLQQYDLALCEIEAALDPVLDEAHRPAQFGGHHIGHGFQGDLLGPYALGRASQVGSDHDRSPRFQREFDGGHGGGDPCVGGDSTIFDRHVQVGADEYALTGEVEVGHAEELGHLLSP